MHESKGQNLGQQRREKREKERVKERGNGGIQTTELTREEGGT